MKSIHKISHSIYVGKQMSTKLISNTINYLVVVIACAHNAAYDKVSSSFSTFLMYTTTKHPQYTTEKRFHWNTTPQGFVFKLYKWWSTHCKMISLWKLSVDDFRVVGGGRKRRIVNDNLAQKCIFQLNVVFNTAFIDICKRFTRMVRLLKARTPILSENWEDEEFMEFVEPRLFSPLSS